MFSIIVCSISPERLSKLSKNIHDTIGVEYEFIGIDNRKLKWPIAKVYNKGAQQAHYPYLFFVHEDVSFHSTNWGEVILTKLQESNCGVIGFAGSKVKLKAYSGWGSKKEWTHMFMYQGGGKRTYLSVSNVYLDQPFEEVVTIDGLGMFVSKVVWAQYPFDEEALTGFHCYDIDFSLQLAATKKFKNYICCTPKVLIEHYSMGNYNNAWITDTIRLHKTKWATILPLKTDDIELKKVDEKKADEKCFNRFIKKMKKCHYPYKTTIFREFLFHSFSWKHIGHCISHLLYFCYPKKQPPI